MANLQEIETFVAIAERGSMTAVSNRTGLALSAVSRRLKELEARLGCTLVQRTTRQMRLTEDGEEFYRRCRQILDDLESAQTLLRDRTERLAGRIRMTAPASFTVLHLSDMLSEFLGAHSAVRLDLDLSDRRVDLLEEDYDLAIRIGTLADSSMIARKLTRIRHLPCASPALLDRLGRPAKPEDLEDYPALTYRARGGRALWRFVRPDGSRGEIAPSARLWASNGDILCRQAAAGLGVIVEPTFLTAPFLLDGRLEPLFSDHSWSEEHAYAVYPQARALPRRVIAMIDHIADRLSSDPPWGQALRDAFPSLAWEPTKSRGSSADA